MLTLILVYLKSNHLRPCSMDSDLLVSGYSFCGIAYFQVGREISYSGVRQLVTSSGCIWHESFKGGRKRWVGRRSREE